jgi:F-type H+-transporting ATPase subunit b
MPQFETATFASQIFWLAICFSILCLAMRIFIVPRITTSLETREQRLQEDWKQSEILLKTGETLKQENLNLLAEAHGRAHSMIHKVVHEIHQRKTKRLAALDDELSIKTKNIRIDLENQTNKILQNIEPLVSQVVKATTPRILGQPLTQTEIKKIVLDVLNKPEQV